MQGPRYIVYKDWNDNFPQLFISVRTLSYEMDKVKFNTLKFRHCNFDLLLITYDVSSKH